MGMSIHGGSYTAAETMQWQQRRQNFDALSQAITSGNLSGANDAMTKIKSLLPPGADVKPDSFLGKLATALQSGDMTAAQQLLASRQNQNRAQAPGADAAQAADAATAATASSASAADANVNSAARCCPNSSAFRLLSIHEYSSGQLKSPVDALMVLADTRGVGAVGDGGEKNACPRR